MVSCLHTIHLQTLLSKRESGRGSNRCKCGFSPLASCAGELICQHVLESQAFREAAVIGIYVHCAKLREVDTTRILVQALASGVVGEDGALLPGSRAEGHAGSCLG